MFLNSLRLSNYEHVFKMEPEPTNDDTDPRLKKVTKAIGKIDYGVETDALESDSVKF